MLKLFLFGFCHLVFAITEIKHGLTVCSLLRHAFESMKEDINEGARIQKSFCFCVECEYCETDSQPLHFRPLCLCQEYLYNHRRRGRFFQIQESKTGNASNKKRNIHKVYFDLCKRDTDVSDLNFSELKTLACCSGINYHSLQEYSLKVKQRICIWAMRRLRSCHLFFKKGNQNTISHRRFRRAAESSFSSDLSPSMRPFVATQRTLALDTALVFSSSRNFLIAPESEELEKRSRSDTRTGISWEVFPLFHLESSLQELSATVIKLQASLLHEIITNPLSITPFSDEKLMLTLADEQWNPLVSTSIDTVPTENFPIVGESDLFLGPSVLSVTVQSHLSSLNIISDHSDHPLDTESLSVAESLESSSFLVLAVHYSNYPIDSVLSDILQPMERLSSQLDESESLVVRMMSEISWLPSFLENSDILLSSHSYIAETKAQLMQSRTLSDALPVALKSVAWSQNPIFPDLDNNDFYAASDGFKPDDSTQTPVMDYSNSMHRAGLSETDEQSLQLSLTWVSAEGYSGAFLSEDATALDPLRSSPFYNDKVSHWFPSADISNTVRDNGFQFSLLGSENIHSDINDPVLQSQIYVEESMISLETPQTERLSIALTHLTTMKESVHDLAGNELNTAFENMHMFTPSYPVTTPVSTASEVVPSEDPFKYPILSFDLAYSPTYSEDTASTLNNNLVEPSFLPAHSMITVFGSSRFDESRVKYEDKMTGNMHFSQGFKELCISSMDCLSSEVIRTVFEPSEIIFSTTITTPVSLVYDLSRVEEIIILPLSRDITRQESFQKDLFTFNAEYAVSHSDSVLHSIQSLESKRFVFETSVPEVSSYAPQHLESDRVDIIDSAMLLPSKDPLVSSQSELYLSLIDWSSVFSDTELLETSHLNSMILFPSTLTVKNSVSLLEPSLVTDTIKVTKSFSSASRQLLQSELSNTEVSDAVKTEDTYSTYSVANIDFSVPESMSFFFAEVFNKDLYSSEHTSVKDMFENSFSPDVGHIKTDSYLSLLVSEGLNSEKDASLISTSETGLSSFYSGEITATRTMIFSALPLTLFPTGVQSELHYSQPIPDTGASCIPACLDTRSLYLAAASSSTNPQGGSAGHSSQSFSQLMPAASSVRDSFGSWTQDLQDRLSSITLIDSNLNTLQSAFWPEMSFGGTSLQQNLAAASVYNTTLPAFPPHFSSSAVMTFPAGVSAFIMLSVADTENLSSVTKTIPTLTADGSTGKKPLSTSFSPVSSFSTLKQSTESLESSLDAITSSSLSRKDYPFTLPVIQTTVIYTRPLKQSYLFDMENSPTQQFFPSPVLPLASMSSMTTMVLISGSFPSTIYSTGFMISSYFKLSDHLVSNFVSLASMPTPNLWTLTTAGSVTVTPTVSQFNMSTDYVPLKTKMAQAISNGIHLSQPHQTVPALSSYTISSLPEPSNVSATAPSVKAEHLLEITLRVNRSVNIFGEPFQNAVSTGLIRTFLQAAATNKTKSKRSAPVINVEIFTVRRLSADVLIEFAVLSDGNLLRAKDVEEILNRLPDLIGTLNENLPYPVVKVPSAVIATSLPPLADFTGWLAAVVVLAVLCVLLVSLLILYGKKSRHGGGMVTAASSAEATGSEEDRHRTSRVHVSSHQNLKDVEMGGNERKPIKQPLLLPRTAPSDTFRIAASAEKSIALQNPASTDEQSRQQGSKVKDSSYYQVAPVERIPQEFFRISDTHTAGLGIKNMQEEESTAAKYEHMAHMKISKQLPMTDGVSKPFQSAVAPLPPLKFQRLTVQDSDSDEELEMKLRKTDITTRAVDRQDRSQDLALKRHVDVSDRQLQRRTDAERQRNKKRQREKLRQNPRNAGTGEGVLSQKHFLKSQAQEECIQSTETSKEKEKRKQRRTRKEKEFDAWRRAQAEITSLLSSQPGVLSEYFRTRQGLQAFPWRMPQSGAFSQQGPQMEFNSFGHPMMRAHPLYVAKEPRLSSSYVANNIGPLAYPWQTGPIPNTRHNAEFLRCIQNPSLPLYNPEAYFPHQPFIFPHHSNLPGSLVDGDEDTSSGGSKSTESHSPQSSSGSRMEPGNSGTAFCSGAPLLDPGSRNYLQLLASLSSQPTRQAEGTHQGNRKVKAKRRKLKSPDREVAREEM
nr:PREDICTED: uncharacterized protein LOC107075802 isoform X1 [Lepisosteus oculatus]XP_015193817.1 PREDICTED: uncharacterized protein LOC107075802 isoform X1 [Lepisosteus oculatus]XP_015193818.1 PREDICTED: uncharacterized protein LOC107075802 isoform X1 [Lepisosteus oculatus]XP_015193819.1 PREDICTED: uncharacterized protein LOC107075802 isoform X1 [Lepisosteus oculatus]